MITKTYTIPYHIKETVEKSVARLMKKADKYGKYLSIEYGETPYIKERCIYETDYESRCEKLVCKENVEVIDVTITSEDIVKDGYTVVAMLEHLDGGNIVTCFTDETNHEWSTMESRCDHCGHKRSRTKTFIVRNSDGEYKQVGKTCLQDYCGIDPQKIGYINSLNDLLLDDSYERFDFAASPAPRAYDTAETLALAIRIYKKFGYRNSDTVGSNKDKLRDLAYSHDSVTDEEYASAKKIVDAVREMSRETAFDNLLDNVKTLCECGYCKNSHLGYIAYAPVAYEKFLEKQEKERKRAEERASEAESSRHVGYVGARLHIHVESISLITSWETAYGVTFLYKIFSQGDVFIWYASSPIRVRGGLEGVKEIHGTVKDHTERDGVKQTVITRCKVIA